MVLLCTCVCFFVCVHGYLCVWSFYLCICQFGACMFIYVFAFCSCVFTSVGCLLVGYVVCVCMCVVSVFAYVLCVCVCLCLNGVPKSTHSLDLLSGDQQSEHCSSVVNMPLSLGIFIPAASQNKIDRDRKDYGTDKQGGKPKTWEREIAGRSPACRGCLRGT